MAAIRVMSPYGPCTLAAGTVVSRAAGGSWKGRLTLLGTIIRIVVIILTISDRATIATSTSMTRKHELCRRQNSTAPRRAQLPEFMPPVLPPWRFDRRRTGRRSTSRPSLTIGVSCAANLKERTASDRSNEDRPTLPAYGGRWR